MSALADAEILALHRDLVATRSVSGEEAAIADRVEAWMKERGWTPRRTGNTVIAIRGEGPLLLLDTHLDTVPAGDGWSRDPWTPTVVDGRVHGLGANDAKASAAAMLAAVAATDADDLPIAVAIALVEGEETSGKGTEATLKWLDSRGHRPAAAVIGEPTGLDVAIAQKGLCVLELVAEGDGCHAANAGAIGAKNAVRELARAITALDDVDVGPPHPELGPTTVEPTRLVGSPAKNALPPRATASLDVRTVPGLGHDALVDRIRNAVKPATLEVISTRLEPIATDADTPIVLAARDARPDATCFASATMSDMVFMRRWPAIKVGPGESARSHTPDEWVAESEILAGAAFYTELIRAFAARVA